MRNARISLRIENSWIVQKAIVESLATQHEGHMKSQGLLESSRATCNTDEDSLQAVCASLRSESVTRASRANLSCPACLRCTRRGAEPCGRPLDKLVYRYGRVIAGAVEEVEVRPEGA